MSRPGPAASRFGGVTSGGVTSGDAPLSTVAQRSLAAMNLRAPAFDGGSLIVPPLDAAGEMISAGCRVHCQSGYDVQGRSLADLAEAGRRELIAAAHRYTSSFCHVAPLAASRRVLLAGHQPQLFHPGVWFKNFALARLAREHSAVAVNLVIDSDTIKEATLKVPSGSVLDPVRLSLPFDDATGEIPYEHRPVQNRELFADFGRQAQQAIRSLVPDPLIAEFWPKVVGRARETNNLGECLSQSRRQLEGEWGLETLELPQSRVCGLEAFHWFTAHLLAQLPRFHEIHNASLAEYRRAHHLRSANHPVPDLAAEQEWLEAPFWLWTAERPQRRRMFVCRSGAELVVSDRAGIEVRLPLLPEGSASRAAEVLAELPRRGICLRTRALTTTMFARLFLGELFLHGIGGGLYDQLTDVLIRRFFQFEPPPFMVLSATMLLPIPRERVTAEEAREPERRLREMLYHPERFVVPLAEPGQAAAVARLVETKTRWLATPQTPANARERWHAIRNANESLAPWLEAQRQQALAERERLARKLRAESVLAWREYAFCLHPRATLQDFLLAFCEEKS